MLWLSICLGKEGASGYVDENLKAWPVLSSVSVVNNSALSNILFFLFLNSEVESFKSYLRVFCEIQLDSVWGFASASCLNTSNTSVWVICWLTWEVQESLRITRWCDRGTWLVSPACCFQFLTGKMTSPGEHVNNNTGESHWTIR